jgi:hypothetical protein
VTTLNSCPGENPYARDQLVKITLVSPDFIRVTEDYIQCLNLKLCRRNTRVIVHPPSSPY